MLTKPEQRPVLALQVSAIRDLGFEGREKLKVVRERIEDPELRERPGADGHCGIRNLFRPKGMPRPEFPTNEYWELLDELAKASTPVSLV